MNPTRSLRTVAAALVLVLVLLTVWSIYNLATAARAPAAPSSTPIASYVANGNGSFVAALSPNNLCNCTQVTGGNVTLFPSIAQSVNVTLDTAVTVSTPASISAVDQFVVTLSTPAWSKSIYSSTNRSSVTNAPLLTTENSYEFNVSAIQALIVLIDGQLNYASSQATLTLSSTVEASITAHGTAGTVGVAPAAAFTFAPSTIATGFLGRSTTGNIDGPAPSPPPVPSSAYLFLGATTVALTAAGWWYARLLVRAKETEPTIDLEELVHPYEEVIAETVTVPAPAITIVTERWEDLVKISDTLGKPILRPPTVAPQSVRSSFYVLDGNVGYLYQHLPGEPAPAPLPPAHRDFPVQSRTTAERLQSVAALVDALSPSDPRLPAALERLGHLRSLLQERRWVEADTVLELLERTFDGPQRGAPATR